MLDEHVHGYLKLFDVKGDEVTFLKPGQLALLEARSADAELCGQFIDREGTYWLLSDRPGLFASLLKLTIRYEPESVRWMVSYGTLGLADNPGWTSRVFDVYRQPLPRSRRRELPRYVDKLARQHVKSRAGLDPKDCFEGLVLPLDAHAMQRQLEHRPEVQALREADVDFTPLITATAGRVLIGAELQEMTLIFCNERDLHEDYGYLLLGLIIPEGQFWGCYVGLKRFYEAFTERQDTTDEG